MKKLTDKQYADYCNLKDLQLKGRLLTPNGVRFICETYNFDAEKIGQHFLDLLPTICPDALTPEDLEELSPIDIVSNPSLDEKHGSG